MQRRGMVAMNRKQTARLFWFLIFVVSASGCAGSGPRSLFPAGVFREREVVRPSLGITDSAVAEYRKGNWVAAQDLFEKSLSLHPDNAEVYYYLAEIRYRERDYDASLALLDKAEIYFGDDASWLAKVYVLMGKNDEARGRGREAAARYRQALGMDPRSDDAARRLGRLTP